MAKARSWEVSGEFWMGDEAHIPKRRWSEAGVYKRGPGGGRKPMDPRKVFEDMVFLLRAGCQWRALPGNGRALTARWSRRPWRVRGSGSTPLTGVKNGSKRPLLVDGLGVPLSLIATGATRHGVSQLGAVPDALALSSRHKIGPVSRPTKAQ